MLKTVSSITNAIGALNYKGTWNANTNNPALASGVGTKGDYYVVGTAGATTLDGISNWGIGDWAVFNGSVWQRVEGGADLNGVNLSVSGTSTLSGLTASTALALDVSKNVVSVTNTGSGNNVLATRPTFASTIGVGAASAAATGAGVSFPATQSASTDPNTLDDYEEGEVTNYGISFDGASTGITYAAGRQNGRYMKVGRAVFFNGRIELTSKGSATGVARITGLPFTKDSQYNGSIEINFYASFASVTTQPWAVIENNNTTAVLKIAGSGATVNLTDANFNNNTELFFSGFYFIQV